MLPTTCTSHVPAVGEFTSTCSTLLRLSVPVVAKLLGLAGFSTQGRCVVVPFGSTRIRSRLFTRAGLAFAAPGSSSQASVTLSDDAPTGTSSVNVSVCPLET